MRTSISVEAIHTVQASWGRMGLRDLSMDIIHTGISKASSCPFVTSLALDTLLYID